MPHQQTPDDIALDHGYASFALCLFGVLAVGFGIFGHYDIHHLNIF